MVRQSVKRVKFLRNQEQELLTCVLNIGPYMVFLFISKTYFGDLFASASLFGQRLQRRLDGILQGGCFCHLYVHLSNHFPLQGLKPSLRFQARPPWTKITKKSKSWTSILTTMLFGIYIQFHLLQNFRLRGQKSDQEILNNNSTTTTTLWAKIAK